MARLTLTHTELFRLWEHATHGERAPMYELERADDAVLYLVRHDRTRKPLSPAERGLALTPEGEHNHGRTQADDTPR